MLLSAQESFKLKPQPLDLQPFVLRVNRHLFTQVSSLQEQLLLDLLPFSLQSHKPLFIQVTSIQAFWPRLQQLDLPQIKPSF